VYTDTVRATPGRPEMVAASDSTRLWLLPKKQMDEVGGCARGAAWASESIGAGMWRCSWWLWLMPAAALWRQ